VKLLKNSVKKYKNTDQRKILKFKADKNKLQHK